MSKPFSQACENNKQPILDVISAYFKAGDRILEIGSGTAQHAVYFCQQLPDINWIPSEIPENCETLAAGLEGVELPNLQAPEILDVTQQYWPVSALDGLFSANCLHIMPAAFNEHFFRGAAEVLKPGATLCVYGPFKYHGDFTSDSNARFDNDFELLEDRQMPANNQCLVWSKQRHII